MRILAMSSMLVALLPLAGAAAEEPTPACASSTPSFATTAANRMSCEEIRKLRASTSAIVRIRRHAQRPNCELRLTRPTTDRGDGSFVQFCEVRCQAGTRSPAFDWRSCSGDATSARTTGVGSCQNGIWCGSALGLGREAESCGTFHREGDRYAYVLIKGQSSCLEGDVTFAPR